MGSGVIVRSSTPLGILRMVGSEGGVGPCQDIGRNWDGCGCDQEDDCSIMGAVWRALALARSKTLHPPFQFSLGLSMGNCCHRLLLTEGRYQLSSFLPLHKILTAID